MNYETTVTADRAEGYPADLDGEMNVRATRRRRLIIIGVIALIVLAGIAFFVTRGGNGANVAAGEDQSQLPVISVITPGTTTIEGQIEASGTLAARRPLPVGSVGEGGRVVSVPVDAGDWVNQGQVLVVIDSSVQTQQIASARANIAVAEADADLAQADLDRALQLVDRGFISQADVDRLTATRDAARARVQVARAQLRELQERTARLNIYAPASGLVLDRNVEPGQTVAGGGEPLFTIAKGGEMEMLAKVSESDLAKLTVGVPATVTPVGTDKRFTGQVWQLSPTIDETNRQGTARIALPYARELRPGGFASATIGGGNVVAPLLPESAVLSDDEGSYVFVIDDENKAQRRGVRIGLVTSRGIAIAEGLTGAEQVVLRAGGFLTAGETVSPRKVTADGN
ncbi:efflux RND transporter periplasmic adaptor subunit [Pelagerythrobacter aerophilus]|uniref:Efflux RND transporter periplasmic adaptor subunit n=1 Tax=Pelagerythrobacter aerophilus TaxID=2306995 RepID=A0A418NE45_9SPHN|nr:efflux RND transporter periplasmic adaptor subunit [Pelagerythrobacter aerophilus]RIV76061.1 efflux RND transporter periplasmic adaptor subunit [Pelagerythrobacter aerophilus]RIV80684.1 efflux RND transporter periplasmic adaptor subunit [Pelagerythrobacter aerophilus]